MSYLPLDMLGFAPRLADNPKQCQLMCAQQPSADFQLQLATNNFEGMY